ncbi:MAG: tail fiber domain-containing protein [Pyrinomonadaceae bacterium]
MDGTAPANGNYDFEFRLFPALTGDTQIGTTNVLSNVMVDNGLFSVLLDFGNQFPGGTRFLEIRVRQTGQSGFTILAPRQSLASIPYSVKSLVAASAETANSSDDSLSLGGIAANQYVLTGDPRLSDSRDPTPNSPNYIRNSTNQQSGSNFNISGTGEANSFLAIEIDSTLYRLSGLRVMHAPFTQNMFVGIGVGSTTSPGHNNAFFGQFIGGSNTTGNNNAYFGILAGNANTSGERNAFFGVGSGQSNTTGSRNSLFGRGAGNLNISGSDNAFFGHGSGQANSTASNNAFFGAASGATNSTGDRNAFFGTRSGVATTNGSENAYFGYQSALVNTTGAGNSFFGRDSGNANTAGSRNTFIGWFAGDTNTTGSDNTILGASADVVGSNLSFATAIGAGAQVSTSNTIALGRANGSDKVQIFGLGAAGSTALCRNSSNEISTCSSSIRYKKNIADFSQGLSIVRRLRPVSFVWRDGDIADLGLVAEDVAKVSPLLATSKADGTVEGVKYDRVGVVLVNAVKEQQKQIESQNSEIEKQKDEIRALNETLIQLQLQLEALHSIVCAKDPNVEGCRRPGE